VLAEPAIKAKRSTSAENADGPPDAFGKMIVAETEKWAQVRKRRSSRGTERPPEPS